jgi:hypothetical protein
LKFVIFHERWGKWSHLSIFGKGTWTFDSWKINRCLNIAFRSRTAWNIFDLHFATWYCKSGYIVNGLTLCKSQSKHISFFLKFLLYLDISGREVFKFMNLIIFIFFCHLEFFWILKICFLNWKIWNFWDFHGSWEA